MWAIKSTYLYVWWCLILSQHAILYQLKILHHQTILCSPKLMHQTTSPVNHTIVYQQTNSVITVMHSINSSRWTHITARRSWTRRCSPGPAQWLFIVPNPHGRGVDDGPELTKSFWKKIQFRESDPAERRRGCVTPEISIFKVVTSLKREKNEWHLGLVKIVSYCKLAKVNRQQYCNG